MSINARRMQRKHTRSEAIPQVTYQDYTFVATSENIFNPERGFVQVHDTHYYANGTGYEALDASWLSSQRDTYRRSIIHRRFYMEKFRTATSIDQAYLTLVANDFAMVRSLGMKVIPRFSYSNVWKTSAPFDSDAPLANTLTHINQLLPILNQYKDIVFAVEAGFIGTWGEWYYTDNYLTGTDPAVVSAADWTKRGQVLNALVDGLDPSIFVQARYTSIKEHIYGIPSSDPRSLRVGFHNDAFLGRWNDLGTFSNNTSRTPEQNRAYMAAEIARPLPMGGESAETNPPTSEWPSASSELMYFRYTTLNPDYHPDVIASWGQAGMDEAARKLGYRLRLTDAWLPITGGVGASAEFALTISNDGYSQPVKARPMQIVFRHTNGTLHSQLVAYDIRQLQPTASKQIAATIILPPSAGTWSMHLWLPDVATSLQSEPRYSIRLANTSGWDAATGYNSLGATVAIK